MTKALLFTASLATCLATAATANEALSLFDDPQAQWTLTEIDGRPFDARATLQFPEPGRVAGQAPCNRFSGTLAVDGTAMTLGPLAATQMACPDLTAETVFFKSLSAMTDVALEDGLLTLRNAETGEAMVFRLGM